MPSTEHDMLLFASITFGTFALFQYLQQKWHHPWITLLLSSPLLLTILTLSLWLHFNHIAYSRYFSGVSMLHFCLQPITVLLAIPLYEERHRVWEHRLPILIALFTACLGSWSLLISFHLLWHIPSTLYIALLNKSITTPIALQLTQLYGGDPQLTAVVVILSGILGSTLLPLILPLGNIKPGSPASAFALGSLCHGVGVAKAFQLASQTAPFASIGVALHAVLSSILWFFLYG
jgi:putative effector of murein hydrolase